MSKKETIFLLLIEISPQSANCKATIFASLPDSGAISSLIFIALVLGAKSSGKEFKLRACSKSSQMSACFPNDRLDGYYPCVEKESPFGYHDEGSEYVVVPLGNIGMFGIC